MGKKITEYPNNVSTNPDDLSLMDLSEKTGLSTFESRKWTLTAFKAWVNSWVVAGSVAWNNITGKPNVVDTTGGTNNYVAKFTPNGTTIGNSQIQDDGNNIGIFKSPSAYVGVYIEGNTSTHTNVIIGNGFKVGAIGVEGASRGAGASENIGVKGIATSSTLRNFGGYMAAGAATVGENIGLYAGATAGSTNYSTQLKDGSETSTGGKFLKDMGDGKANWAYIPKTVQLAVSDETTALTTGTGKITFRMPHAMTLTEVRASLTTAQASGNIFTVDINEGGFSILSTKLTIDNNEKTSVTATTQPVISDTYLTDDTEITVDIDQIGNGTAKGLKITLIGY